MKKTHILLNSIKLFNNLGVANTTIRKIANASKMSSGNLNYHFKKRVDILESLFDDIQQKELQLLNVLSDRKISNGKWRKEVLKFMSEMMMYRFIWIDRVQINRESVKIKQQQEKLKIEELKVFSPKGQLFFNQWLFTCVVENRRFSERTLLNYYKKLIEIEGR